MARRSKSDSRKDLISKLPVEIKERILDRLPTRDAARTALLSRGWRDAWLGHGRIVVDEDLLECVKRCEEGDKRVVLVNMINDILLRYGGSIKKFTLCTFISDPELQQSDLDRWFLFLSRNGIQELHISLYPCAHRYKLPFCIISCRTIKKLILSFFIFDWPKNAASCMFSGLTSLCFEHVQFSDKVNGIVCSIPNLEKLGFHFCHGMSNFEIKAPKLESLSIICCTGKLRWLGFHLKAIKTLCVGADELLQDDFVLATSMFPSAINLQVIKLCPLNFASREQFIVALQLLKNSPNLCELGIQAPISECLYDEIRLPEDIIDQDLKMLKTLKIELFRGSTLKMSFVKMVLSKSPALEKVVIQESDDIDASIAVKISRELLRFPRASKKAQIVYMDYYFFNGVVGFPVFTSLRFE